MQLFVKTEVVDRVARITLNRPEKRNALHQGLISELTEAVKEANENDAVKVILVLAAGPVFCAGADLGSLLQVNEQSAEQHPGDPTALKELFAVIYSSVKITIACVEGHAIAGGCGLISVCDLVFSVPEAKFGYTEVKIGFIPALVAPFLEEKVGPSRCMELLLTGDLVSAETAVNYGLVNFIVEKDSMAHTVKAYAERLCLENSGVAIAAIKGLLHDTRDLPLAERLEKAAIANAAAQLTSDFKKGVKGVLTKNKVTW